MATPTHCQSMYIPPPTRPDVGRQRSNSLPVGLLSMNGQEAGMMFSAAERATARRRKLVSVDTPSWMNGPSETIRQSSRPSTRRTVKQSQFRQVTQVRISQSYQAKPSRALQDLDASQVTNARSTSPSTDFLLKSLPISPASPTKRQVSTRSLKTYADGLFQFTQNALVAKIPQLASPPQSPNIFEDVFSDELALSKTPSHSQRPSLESKFSDWSISTGNSDSRRSSVDMSSPQPIELDSSLMSPDSFFAGLEETPRRRDFLRETQGSGYASSATYDPPLGMPALTPLSRVAKVKSTKEEFSYFTNFDQYLDRGEPESLEINLSPIEVANSPITPPVMRRRADTVIRAPLIARSCSAGPTNSRFAQSTPSTPFDHVPNWLVGAIG